MTDDFASVAETEETVNADPIDDPIFLERKIGATRASVQLMSGLDVWGKWAAGDSQAFRQLIRALMEVADGATAQVDRARRQINDLTDGQRVLRDQLRVALDDLNDLHAGREYLAADNARLLAEVTKLQAAAAQPQPTMTVEMADMIRERDSALREVTQLRDAFTVEKRRADTAVERMRRMQEIVEVTAENTLTDMERKARDAASAADLAFEEAKWKEGGRYLKLANMWIGLLNAVGNTTQE